LLITGYCLCRRPLAGCLAGWLAGWLTGWLAGWLDGWLALPACLPWLAGCLAGWLVGWLAGLTWTHSSSPDLDSSPIHAAQIGNNIWSYITNMVSV